MGNCCRRCFGRIDKRGYLRTRYNIDRDRSIEFENLMDDNNQEDEFTKVLTPTERTLLVNRQYKQLDQLQNMWGSGIDIKLIKQEEDLRLEEEAFYEAKREAARVAQEQKSKDNTANKVLSTGAADSWVDNDDEWEVAGGEEDFEMFLESVKARSLAARTRTLASQVPIDASSETSGSIRKSHTDASSIDLEWEHETGMDEVESPNNNSVPHNNNTGIHQLAVGAMINRGTEQPRSNYTYDQTNSSNHLETQSLINKLPNC